MLQSDYKSQTFDNLADNRTPPAPGWKFSL